MSDNSDLILHIIQYSRELYQQLWDPQTIHSTLVVSSYGFRTTH